MTGHYERTLSADTGMTSHDQGYPRPGTSHDQEHPHKRPNAQDTFPGMYFYLEVPEEEVQQLEKAFMILAKSSIPHCPLTVSSIASNVFSIATSSKMSCTECIGIYIRDSAHSMCALPMSTLVRNQTTIHYRLQVRSHSSGSNGFPRFDQVIRAFSHLLAMQY
jgi:hypothetical protein